MIKNLVKKIPQLKKIINERNSLIIEANLLREEKERVCNEVDCLLIERDKLLGEVNKFQHVPPGHFYSAIPNLDEIKAKIDEIWCPLNPNMLDGINLNPEKQLLLINNLQDFYTDIPWGDEKSIGKRYYYNNTAYSYSDAICLYFMIRYLKPKNIIEVGSGHSSCVMLDTNELFLDNSLNITFIEPYPQLLESLFKPEDRKNNKLKILASNLQDIPLDTFCNLQANDILFIDSTHVSKINSDVNYLIHKILPILNDGVYIHIHDVFYPFEYPKDWVFKGLAWN
jgi:hypothetical protein